MPVTLAHQPMLPAPPSTVGRSKARRPRSMPSPWSFAPGPRGDATRWIPVARAVTLAPPPPGSAAALDIDERMAEAMECAVDAAKCRRFPPVPTAALTSEVDVLGLGYYENAAYLLTVVRDDADAAAYAALRVLYQTLVWTWACSRDRDGFVGALNALGVEASEPDRARGRVESRSDFALGPVIAFDAPPELVTVRRVHTLLHELAPLDPHRIVEGTQLLAWPRGLEPFRIPPSAGSARPSKRRCRACGSPYVVKIVHGYPMDEALEAARRGEMILAGCIVTGNDPRWGCRACGTEW